jgi:molecular chaperone GrpE (heat shock protein)
MSCYLRHLKGIFDELGIEVTKENRKQLDQAIHEVVQVKYKNCSQTWKAVKKRILGDSKKRKEFLSALNKALG